MGKMLETTMVTKESGRDEILVHYQIVVKLMDQVVWVW